MNTAKISKWQLLSLLLLCRIFTLMTFVPAAGKGCGISVQLAACIISTLIQAVLVIPATVLGMKYESHTVTSLISVRSSIAGRITAALYLIFFLAYASGSVIHFIRFLGSRFFGGGSIVLAALLMTVCVYCACCGVEGLSRSSVIAVILFVIMLLVMAWTSKENFEPLNFYSESLNGKLWRAVADDLARNGEITAAVFLMKNTGRDMKCGLYGLLAAKLVLTAASAALITGVLGDLAEMRDYPLMELGSCTDASLFRQNDSLYLILWTISAVISISLFIHISAGLLQELAPKLKGSSCISGAAIFIISAAFMYYKADFSAVRNVLCGFGAIVLLVFAIPLAVLLMKGKKENEKNS